MKIRLLNDLHRESGPYSYEDQGEDVLVLAGDIDNGIAGIEWAKTIPKPVIYVAGNHEHWMHDMHTNIEAMRVAAQGSNVHFLECDEVFLTIGDETVRFLGCTLWTDYCQEYLIRNGNRTGQGNLHQQMMWAAEQTMRDFDLITYKGEKLTPAVLLTINNESVNWLKSKLHKLCEYQTVVVTHHSPSYESLIQADMIERDELAPVIWGMRRMRDERVYRVAAYASDMEDLVQQADYWMHGHIHGAISCSVKSCILYCNPRGYHMKPLTSSFWFYISKKNEAASLRRYNKNPEQGDVTKFSRALIIDTLMTKKSFMLNKATEQLKEVNKVIKAMAAHVKYLSNDDAHIVAMSVNKTNDLTMKYNALVREISKAVDSAVDHQRQYNSSDDDVGEFRIKEYELKTEGTWFGHDFTKEDITHFLGIDMDIDRTAKRALKIMRSSAKVIKHKLKQFKEAP